jgi:sec-independent protein translocase protein TatA
VTLRLELFVGNFGPGEILIVLVIAVLLFGRGRLPGMGRKASDQFHKTRDAVSDAKDEFERGLHEVDDPTAPVAQSAAPRARRRSWLTPWRRR